MSRPSLTDCLCSQVGAAVGYYTLLVASAHPEAKVYGFNPSEFFRKQMAQNIRINFGGRSGPPTSPAPICIEPRAMGLSDGAFAYVNGEFGGRVSEAQVERSGGHVDVTQGVRDVSESTSVTMSTWLAETLGADGEVWMMMVDIQGTEGKVMRAAQQDGTLARGRVRQFFIGIHSGNNLETIQVDLTAAGYEILYAEAKVDKLSPDGL